MKKPLLRLSLTSAALAAALCGPVAAEDIDLFNGTNSSATNPNIVIMIDNSANWDAANQHWANGKQGESEIRALARAVGEVKPDSVNLGLMLFTPGVGSTPNGAYVRFHVRQMTVANKLALQQQLGIDSNGNALCNNANNTLTGSPNCIFQNFSSPNEKVGTAKLDYSAGLFEVFKYFGGFTDPAHAINDSPLSYTGATPIDASHFGALRYARNGGSPEPNSDPAAYNGANFTGYNPPFAANGSNSCARNYLIFIGNGFPNQDAPASLLTGVNGNATQLKMPGFATTPRLVTTTLGTDNTCRTQAACVTAAGTTFPGYDSYSCTGGNATPDTVLGTDATCESATACATRAQSQFPGHTSYYCTGGSSSPPQSTIDKVCRTQLACAAAGTTVLPGFTSYACSGGTSTTGNITLGTDTVTESVAACKTRAAALFPGFGSYNCTGGTVGAVKVSTTTTTVCETPATCLANAPGAYPGHDVYVSCTGGTGTGCTGQRKTGQTVTFNDTEYTGMTMIGIGCAGGKLYGQTLAGTNACLQGQTMKATDSCITGQTVKGINTVNEVVGTGTFDTPAANKARNADEWAKYLFSTDANGVTSQQNISTYTIDVFKDAQDGDQTALLMSMAKYGGGRYFQATNEDAILNALREILTEIQSVNTVFASASLPINATNRSQNENQVFIGMFRPDGKGKPKWYGNLKHYQVALFGGDARLADKLGQEAIAATTGFIQACAQSFYTVDSDVGTPVQHYWDFSPISAGRCTSLPNNSFNDLPDGGVVEKGGAAEVLRRGNDVTTPTTKVNRTMLTCTDAPCSGLTPLTDVSVSAARTGGNTATPPTPSEHTRIIEFTKGKDWLDENNNAIVDETRPSMHGDIAHSRPLPVNFGGSRGVEVIYGSNDGALHAMRGSDGKELWAFVAPEHHAKLKRLYANDPPIKYPDVTDPTALAKDYFFDGSAGLYQTIDSSKVWIFPTMRRGGRMIYAFDVSKVGDPVFKWSAGCPNMGDDTKCTGLMDGIGQTWSVPNAAFIAGYPTGVDAGTKPVIIVGGGWDACEDSDKGATTCTNTSKGHAVYVLDADDGTVLKTFKTEGSVPADVTLIDRNFDGKVDHGYVLDTRGNLYRIDFVDPNNLAALGSAQWTMTKIAGTSGAYRKFLFAPSALATTGQTYLAFGSGDRERPLERNYPYQEKIQNRFYMFIDRFPPTSNPPIDLDGASLQNNSSETTCASELTSGLLGWYMDLTAGQGEQVVTSSVIFGGTIFFSTNRPVPVEKNSCATNLGEARGYALNLLNASGVIGSGSLCGGDRSGTFTGGGLPPSPVVGTVPVKQVDGTVKPISVLIGGINLDGQATSPISAQQPPVPIKSIRSRIYWYKHGDK
ncbi:MAG TPA: PilC/PilY family type IV pilus protein [Vicinamibacterales bacterium]|nr:PilC/PilY family type IV pilus protein [Vicinamibacterales bacterium]